MILLPLEIWAELPVKVAKQTLGVGEEDMIHLGEPAGLVASGDLERLKIQSPGKHEIVKILADGATSLSGFAERASHAVLKVSGVLSDSGSVAAYQQHRDTLEEYWSNYQRASSRPGGRKLVDAQIADEREAFTHARADATAQSFVALDRALAEVGELVSAGPGGENRAVRITELRDSLAAHAKAAATEFSKIADGLGSDRDTGYELGGRLSTVEQHNWATAVWGLFSQVSSEIRQAIEEQTHSIVQSAFPDIRDGSRSGLTEHIRRNPAFYSDDRFSTLVHQFVGFERALSEFEKKPVESLMVLKSWATKIAGLTAVETAEVSPLLKALRAGPEGSRHNFIAACEALAHFGWQTNAAFDRTQGEKTGVDPSLDKVESARESCVRDLVREVNAQLSSPNREGPRWDDPYQPFAALKSFGCQGLTAAMDIARQNPWRADYVREVLEELRTVSDPRPGGNFKYLDALQSTKARPLAEQVRREGVALCMAHLDSKDLSHEALWTVIHLAPGEEAVRERVRALLTSERGCREVGLIEGYKSHLGLTDQEIAAAWELSRKSIAPQHYVP